VANGRNMPQSMVDSIGQGRVWSGKTALQLGLVDTLGGLNDAIKIAADLAKIKTYRTYELPIQKEPFSELLEDLNGGVKTAIIKNELGPEFEIYHQVSKLIKQEGVFMRMPFELQLN
ncbi:MAG TPA: S49 family peptidase, partial [Bacteroidia bacterium]|nr:S49 family peptidase [Bacteroidia bacterium]